MSFFISAANSHSVYNYSISKLSSQTFNTIKETISKSFQVPTHQIPRVLFHGLLLSNIVAGFWLLDSLKDPILSNIVGIEYQPIAKLLSVLTTLFIVCLYDFLTSIVSKPTLFHIISCTFGTIVLILSALLADPNLGLQNNHKNPFRVLGWIAYFTTEAYGSLMVALFWSYTNSIMDLEQAKGAYGLIIAIAQMGALVGSTLATNSLTIGISQLFLIASMLIYSISLLIKIYHLTFQDYVTESTKKRVRTISESSNEQLLPIAEEYDELLSLNDNNINNNNNSTNNNNSNNKNNNNNNNNNKDPHSQQTHTTYHTKQKPSLFHNILLAGSACYDGLSLIIKYNYIRKLFGVSCLYEVIVTILDYEFKLLGSDSVTLTKNINKISSETISSLVSEATTTLTTTDNVSLIDHQTSDRFANLLGHFGQFTNIISFCVSFFGFSYLVHHLGVSRSLMIFPMTLLIAVIITYLVPTLWVSFALVSILKAMIFSLHDPVKELLYIPTSDAIKFKAKAWIDVFGSRFAKAFGSIISYTAFGNIHHLRNISEIPCLVISIIIIILTYQIGQDFNYMIIHNEIVGEDRPVSIYTIDLNAPPIRNGLKPGDV
eukprot:gene9270-12487_t